MADPNDPTLPDNDPNDPGYGAPYPGEESETYTTDEGLESGVPEVATNPRRVLLVLILMLGGIGFVIYLLFFSGEEEAVKPVATQQPASAGIEPELTPPTALPTPPPALPTIPTTPTATEVPTPPPTPEFAAPSAPEPTNEERQARLRSNMLILDAQTSGGDAAAKARAQAALAGSDPNNAFAQNAIAASEAEKAVAKKIDGNLKTTIAQGKIIDAVLETAINSDLPGTLRAIVSRDIFPESGRNVMLPKGSRLIGQYNTGILRGQKRVFIIWTRVIRPDGIDVMIASPGIDNLGRAGVAGYVDSKYMEVFSGAILTSALTIGTAIGADKALGNDNQVVTSQNTDGTVTQGGTAGAIATADALNNVGNVAKSVLTGMLDIRPTITVDQGTKVNVFVNRDLIFPPEVSRVGNVIP